MSGKISKISKNIDDTAKLAKLFLQGISKEKRKISGASVIALSGDLGVGKTAFTRAIGAHLGIKNKIKSPTFVIIKKYPIKLEGYKFLFHLDAYRLKNEEELLHLGWEEIIGNREHLVFIEWPENVAKVIPENAKTIHISHLKNGHRGFKFN